MQKSIPVDRIYPSGIWQSGDVFSRMWAISDVNYTMLSEEAQKQLQRVYGAIYSCIPPDCWCKLCVVSQRMDEKAFERDVLFHRGADRLNDYRIEYNKIMKSRSQATNRTNISTYFLVCTDARSIEEAEERIQHCAGQLLSAFSVLGCSIVPCGNVERCRVLHGFFRMGEEENFQFDFESCARLGQDFRDYIAPDHIHFGRDCIAINDHMAKVLAMATFAQSLPDNLIPALLRKVPYVVLCMDVQPVSREDAARAVDDFKMKLDADKGRFNRKSVGNMDFVTNLPHYIQEQEQIIEHYHKALSEQDEQMFLVNFMICCFSSSEEELKREIAALKAQVSSINCHLTDMKWQQENAFNTVMPYGTRRVDCTRTMLTRDVAGLVPFSAQELLIPKAVYYGANAITGKIIMGSRLKLVNGNGVVLAVSGAGKSCFVKNEIAQVLLRYPDARILIVDPEGEYRPMVEALGGIVIDLAIGSETHFNPLDFVPDGHKTPQQEKAEFILALCNFALKGNMVAGDDNLIDKALQAAYKPMIRSHYESNPPTLEDFRQSLIQRKSERAEEIADALELYTTGSFSIFAQQTNVDLSNRLVCFNISGLGPRLRDVATLCMLEFINGFVEKNRAAKREAATWVYFDEAHVLLRDPQSANFLLNSWKRFRKYNALATAITQNLEDCLRSEIGYALIANSEFVAIMRQAEGEGFQRLSEMYRLSEAQRNYLLQAQHGAGILKMGSTMLTCENEIPQESKLFKLLTTTPGENCN